MWSETRRGRLLEMAATLGEVQRGAEVVLLSYPDEVEGRAELEQAIGLIGQCETELEQAARYRRRTGSAR